MSNKYAVTPSGEGGDKFPVGEKVGHLLEFAPIGRTADVINTTQGPAQPMQVNIRDITEGITYNNALIFQTVLISSMEKMIGQVGLAYLRRGVAKPGKNAPFLLVDATTDQEALDLAGQAPGLDPATPQTPTQPAQVPATPAAPGTAAAPASTGVTAEQQAGLAALAGLTAK